MAVENCDPTDAEATFARGVDAEIARQNAEAIRLYQAAAAAGHTVAAFRLGQGGWREDALPREVELEYLQIASDKGHFPSTVLMAKACFRGEIPGGILRGLKLSWKTIRIILKVSYSTNEDVPFNKIEEFRRW